MGFGISTVQEADSFTPETIQFLLIDVQEKLFPKIGPHEHLLKQMQIWLEAAKILSFPVTVTEQYPQGLGSTVPELKKLIPEQTTVVEKLHFSCLQHPQFEEQLPNRKIVIVAGIETHICVYQTVVDLLNHDYRVWVPIDAVGSRTKQNWKVGLSLMEREGAWLASTETLLFRLLKVAGTDAFKQISKWVK